MTNAMTPMFEMQRTAIKQNQKAMKESVEAQKTAFQSLVQGVESNRTLTERNAELSRSAMHAYLDAVESALPEDAADFDEIREVVDDGFETWSESQADAWDGMIEAMEESSDAYEEFADSYMEAVDSSFDAFLDNHERIEASFDQAAETIEVEAE